MGCDLSNTVNESSYRSGYPVVVHPHDGASIHNQYSNQAYQPPQNYQSFEPFPSSQVAQFPEQQYPKNFQNISNTPSNNQFRP
jgi:hypothetical protein